MSIASTAPLPTLLFAAFATLAVTGCTVSFDLDDDTTRRIERDTVPVDGLTAIDVTTGNGQIEVVGGGGDDIAIRTVLQESDDGDAEYRIERDGDLLRLVGECDSGWFESCSVAFRAVVPDDIDVRVETDNGRVAVDGVAGDVDIETDNGAIDGEGLEAAIVQVRTDNGRIQLLFDAAPSTIDARTDNGAIAIRVPGDDAYDVDADSDNGSVEVDVRTDPDADRRVVAQSDNGAIDVEYHDPS